MSGLIAMLLLWSFGAVPLQAQDHPLRLLLPTDPAAAIAPHALQTDDPDERTELLAIDTLFYVENRGLSRILVELNGYHFKLVTDSQEVHQSQNAFLIPQHGEITVNIGAYIDPEDENYIVLASQGPPGSDAEVIIADLMLPGQQVAYFIEGLVPLPEQFALLQSYPNPFREQTTITYSIPERRIAGLPVHLAVYDVLGRQVRLLVDERRYPGTFTVVWDGTSGTGSPAAAGVYFCQIVAEDVRQTIQIVRLH